jgi:RNA-binding protein
MDKKQKANLVAAAHHLNPVVMIGQKGLTPQVTAEADSALTAHELIKIKVVAEDKEARTAMVQQICDELNAEFLKLIGNIAIIYRKSED